MNTRLSHFLPSEHGDGLKAYAMIYYLVDAQNDILKLHYKENKCDTIDANLIENKDYLIDFDSNEEVLKILKSNFTYDSKESRYLFQFENINEIFINRYIKYKPFISTRIPVFEYSDEINDLNFFIKLNSVIEQVRSIKVA